MSPSIHVDVTDHVATVTIDRPPVNAITMQAMLELRTAFESFNDRRDVRVAIFTGAGSRAFIAGVDLKEVSSGLAPAADVAPTVIVDSGRVARDAMWAITDCAVPVIAAVNGPAIGGGLALAACCDIIIAAEHARFGTTEINVGLLGASAHLSLLVGRHKARELFFTGELISAAELYRLGALRAVVSSDELMPTALTLARELAAKSPIALRLAKEAMNRVEHLPLKEAYRTEQEYTRRLMTFDDSVEARQAFMEKRPAEYHWR